MDDFQKKVVGVAAVLLILVFASTYYLLNVAAKSEPWPPSISSCPDYWDYDASNQVCINSRGLGNFSNPFDVSFNPLTATAPTYNNVSGKSLSSNCGKYCYAQSYNIPWGGINYGITNMPC
jgi:hypothetical protein